MILKAKHLKEFLETIPDDVEIYFRARHDEPFEVVPIKGLCINNVYDKPTHVTLEAQAWSEDEED